MPNYDQLIKTVQILQALSNLNREILFFMYDDEREEFYVLAGKMDLLSLFVRSPALYIHVSVWMIANPGFKSACPDSLYNF